MSDHASMIRTLPTPTDVDGTLVVESCRNGMCSTQRLVRREGHRTLSGWVAEGNDCREPSREGRICEIKDQDRQVRVSWWLEDKSAKTGDEFRMRVIAETSGKVLLDESVTATFAEVEPNGEDCGVAKVATL